MLFRSENGGDSPNYEPNSFGGAAQDPRYREAPYKVSGDVNRYDQEFPHILRATSGKRFQINRLPEM